MDQGSTMKRSAAHNFAPTVTKFCVMWEGQALPHDTKFGNSRCEIVDRSVIFIWSLIHGSSWSGLIKVGPGIYTSLEITYSRIQPPTHPQTQNRKLSRFSINSFSRLRVQSLLYVCHCSAGIILCMRPANERRRYNVTSPLSSWAYSQNEPWLCYMQYRAWHIPLPVHPEQVKLSVRQVDLSTFFF